jgi:ribose 5-phosphate isomerase B
MHKRIVLGADHAGFALKERLKRHLIERGVDVIDEGTFSEDPVDYPGIGRKVASVMLSENIPGVFLTGSYFDGVSVSDTIAHARAEVDRVVEYLKAR